MASKHQIDKAGERLRDWWKAGVGGDYRGMRGDLDTLWEYRATFQGPQTRVTANLRYYVQRESKTIVIGQRLKRMPQIVNKLARHEPMRLTQMQDIGGCRAILAGGLPEVRAVQQRLEKRWVVTAIDDYVNRPQATGYRAVHLIVARGGRLVEVQLRTPAQHAWALAVEGVDLRHPAYALKDGGGPPVLQEYFRAAAESMASRELGEPPDPSRDLEIHRLREAAEKHF